MINPFLRGPRALTVLALLTAAALVGCGDDDNNKPVTYVQIDRMAIPAINTALIPTAQKEAFNKADPANDVANYRAVAQGTITGLRAAVNAVSGFPGEDSPGVPAATLASVLIPDVVTINFANAVAFPNGRRLTDDVTDAAVGLVLNRGNVLGGGPGLSDGITNDSVFSSTFPYLAAPNP